MPVEIRVGPPTITISQGRTFMVTTQGGEIEPNTDQGVYSMDTRFLSYYKIYLNREPLKRINASQLTFYAARYHLTNKDAHTQSGTFAKDTLGVTINRIISEGVHEDIEIANYTGVHIKFILELAMRSDFSDLFEVKSGDIVQRGEEQTTWYAKERRLRTTYDNKDFHRAIDYCVLNDVVVGYANGRVYFDIELQPNEHWGTCCEMILEHGQKIQRPDSRICSRSHTHHGKTSSGSVDKQGQKEIHYDFDERQARWRERCTAITTSNNDLQRMYDQAIEDMGALRIYDMDVSDEAWVPAAGVPWFVTLFGRDSLTVSYQNMAVAPGFARGALQRLAEHQAKERSDWHDAQPGKIMHELRVGELSYFNVIPFNPYYGTADATILYLIVLSEAYRWTGDVQLLTEFREVADKCLDWIDHYGDLDGDGFQEYKTFSSVGYPNMSWKDAEYAVVYADGTQVKQPKGTCELQGYVYDAKTRMAEAFRVLGDEARAKALEQQAQVLKERFNMIFWMEDEGCYAFGLDPEKKQITSVASNTGQCLWSGIAEPEKAKRVAKRLLQKDMYSGWGIRTLSYKNPSYNPLAYQLGAIWPQDNGIIAAGFKRYGLTDEANKVIRGVFDAIERFDAYRPPEVFAGVQREGANDFPILYPGGANIPQAWATGSIFHMVRTMLGLRADAPNKRLYVWPTLPDWLPDMELHHLRVGQCLIDLRFWREGSVSRWTVLDRRAAKHGTHLAKEDMIEVEDDPERLNALT
ncbi:MAG TPA: amylo-alpha-1,6-glucosidase [Ktedonobacter sp.]|nr:amylo-alpha-1,6-glucosidase [Ktedonobacter sp.]